MEDNFLTGTIKMIAVNFAEWIDKRFLKINDSGAWHQKEGGTPDESFTIEEVYELFLEDERWRIEIKKTAPQLLQADVIKSVCQCTEAEYSIEHDNCGKCNLPVKE